MDHAGHESHPRLDEVLDQEQTLHQTTSMSTPPQVVTDGTPDERTDEASEEVDEGDDDNDSVYSLDYEFAGPRHRNYRDENDPDSDASDLSDAEDVTPRFDMWDNDPYSINDFSWDANDMRLTSNIKSKLAQLCPQTSASFWRKEKGWPRQLPFSSSTTNHEQSANALCLLQSDYGTRETLFTVYRDRIIECGRPPLLKKQKTRFKACTTWLESTVSDPDTASPSSTIPSGPTKADVDRYCQSHLSVSLRSCQSGSTALPLVQQTTNKTWSNVASRLTRFTKYIKRSDFTAQDAYVTLGFEPQSLAFGYGYMAIGGVEGEFELYCCMAHQGDPEPSAPVKIWGTKFKGKNNVMLMTNSIEFARLGDRHVLIACLNEAGVLIYDLPLHTGCQDACRTKRATPVHLNNHLRCFEGVPINDAKLSPDQQHLVCVGDDAAMFLFDVRHRQDEDRIEFLPCRLTIPPDLLHGLPYSSQYVAWSHSSRFFAHTSDTHSCVLVWSTETRELLYSIDAAGYTYAIAFHPSMEGVLVFTNRYGYFHTVNLDEVTADASSAKVPTGEVAPMPASRARLLNLDRPTSGFRGHPHPCHCRSPVAANVDSNQRLQARREITMVAFRGERDRRLRILAKINGIQWSRHGRYLYVATKKRVLAYEFLPHARRVTPLLEMASRQLCEQLDGPHSTRKRKQIHAMTDTVPTHLLDKLLARTPLASHW